LLSEKAYYLAQKYQSVIKESMALSQMAAAFKNLGNFPKSLEYFIEQLKIEEKIGSPDRIAAVYLNITQLYDNAADFEKSITYAKKADSIISKNKLTTYAPYSLLNLGDIYEKKNMLDSALLYTGKCYDLSMKAGNALVIGTALNNLGNIYAKLGRYQEALNNFEAGVIYQKTSDNYNIYAESLLGIAKIFEKTGPSDSATYYGKQSFAIASGYQFIVKSLDASTFLTRLYKANKNIDSAFVYQEIMTGLKDSVDSREKIKDLQSISAAEQFRQAELEQLKLAEARDREIKLQFLIIGIAIPIFFLLSVFISRKKVHKRLIEFTGIVSVLLFFEFITLLLHPFIAEKSHHSPLIEIVVFVGIAAIITPTHHKIQHWLLNKLAEYNYLKHHQPLSEPQKNITEEDPEQA
jgi:tetratricopeptide (TPR) repeat protein